MALALEIEASAETHALPLCVDLDGTLIRSDLLVEGLIAGGPARLPRALFTFIAKGKAALKAHVASGADLEVDRLPYDKALLAYLRSQKEAGRYLVLATAAHESVAKAVARHLRLFDEVIASTSAVNLKGRAKAAALCARFGEKGFVYAGDSRPDMAVWRRAAAAVVVDRTGGLIRRAASVAPIEASFSTHQTAWPALVRALRPHQWLKNLLVFVPIFTAHALGEGKSWLMAALTFVAFCATASAIYLVNDAVDVQADRRHPRKSRRPFASGDLPFGVGLGASALLLGLGLGVGAAAGVALVVAAYAAMSLAYSAKLKEMPLADVFMLAALYTIRLFGGGVATGHELSLWLLAYSGFLFLGLAMLKRVTELRAEGANDSGASGRRGYTPADAQILQIFGCASSFCSSLVLALFVQREATAAQYASPILLWATVPLMLFWQCRLWLSTARGYMHDDPIVYAARDWVSWTVGATVLALLFLAHSVAI